MTKLSVAAVAAACLLAACSDGGGAEDTSSTSTSEAGAGAFDPDRQAPAAPVAGAVAGGTVTVLSTFAPATLDPTATYSVAENSILSGLVTRSLTQYVYDPARESMVLIPDIATDLGRPNDDFTQWSFTIRDGVRFEDGTKVTADDVAFGIKRSFDRKTFVGGASYSNQYFLNGDTYRGPYVTGTKYAGLIVDGDTLTLKMARPFPDMPYWAAFPAMSPIQEQGSDPATYGRHPLATGPYKIDHFVPGKSLTLVRNDQWDRNTDPGRHAYPDRYVFRFGQQQEQIATTILGDSDQARTTLSTDSVLAADYRQAEQLGRVTVGAASCTHVWWPDFRKITDIRVREAIGYAYPYKDAATILGGISGVTFIPGTSILPPGFPGRQDYNVLDIPPGRTDPAKAKALLKQAGYAPGEYELRWAYLTTDPVDVQLAEQLVTSLEAAGFKANPFPTRSGPEEFALIEDPNAPINLRGPGWCSDWPSGSSWFPLLFQSNGSGNDAYFSEPTVDKEIARIGALPIDQQPAAWAALDKLLMTHYYPAIITDYRGDALLHGSKIGGMNNDNLYGWPAWKNINIRQ